MRNIAFVPKAFKEYQEWIATDRKMALRIGDLIRDILRNPFEGLGKPEPLKHQFKGYWSRRIDHEHRLSLWRDRRIHYHHLLFFSL